MTMMLETSMPRKFASVKIFPAPLPWSILPIITALVALSLAFTAPTAARMTSDISIDSMVQPGL